ncbi:MAG: 1-phosphofructokinase, partial [Chloroflexota bacterium]
MIFTVTLNPVLDRTLTVSQISFNDVLRATNTRLDWGGKGLNVSRALKVMGKDSLASGFLGGATGDMLENGLKALGIGTQFIRVQGETRTNVIIIDKEASKHIKVNEAGPKIKPEEIEALLHFTQQRALPGDLWAFCGSLPPGVPNDIYARLISIVQEKGAKAILDTSGEALRLGCMAKPFLIKPNMLEAEVVTGFPIRSEEDVVQAAHKFIEMGIEIAAISMGAKGLFIASHNNTARVYPPSIKEKNPTGAGDALLGGIIWALDQGFPLESIARWGVAAGTAAASLNGVSIGTKEEIESLYGLLDPSYPALPGYLMTSEIGSFARSTIEERKLIIIRQVTEDFAYPPEIVQSLTEFTAEIASQPIQPLSEKADDVTFWNQEMSLYAGRTWLELPWYFAETWFYRRLLECTHYLQPGDWKDIDPFQKQKEKQIQADTKRLSSIWEQFAGLDSETLFTALLHSCLWGNRTDLSNFTVKVKAAHGLATQGEVENILIDDTQQVHDLLSKRVKRVDFINDNSGIDVLFDLVLADFILQQDWSREVIFNLKQRPFFVSDAMPKDIL